jgi:hypothetical protein
MEPTISQIKEYVREKNIDIFRELGVDSGLSGDNSLYGDNQIEVYYQYYLEHSVEIVEWLNNNHDMEERKMLF